MAQQYRIDAHSVRITIQDLVESFNDLNMGGVAEDMSGTGSDPRSPQLAGCVRNCRGKEQLDEIIGYMQRLQTEIQTHRGHEHYSRFMRIWHNTRANLDACVTPVKGR